MKSTKKCCFFIPKAHIDTDSLPSMDSGRVNFSTVKQHHAFS